MYFLSKTEILTKLFFILSFTGLLMYIILAFYSFHTAYSTVTEIGKIQNKIKVIPHPDLFKARRFDNDLKYILIWNPTNARNPVGEGQKPFIENKCKHLNCFLTTDKDILDADYTNFDAVIFNMSLIPNWMPRTLPAKRLPKQKYIFHSMMPSNDFPLCNIHLDKYFNWTWSYKLYSDIITPFVEVKNINGTVVAPDTDIEWKIFDTNYTKVGTKSKAVVFVTGKCKSSLNAMSYGNELKHFLKEHNLSLDVYGCGGIQCANDDCSRDIGNDYYFYMVYESSGSEDYVNLEVLHAFNSGAVPILAGGSDFSKFFPDGSYIDARGVFPERLAAIIHYSIKNPAIYYGHHRWRNHYTIHPVNILRGFCNLCSLLNDEQRVKLHTSYETFRRWWYYGPLSERCYPRGAEKISDVMSYAKLKRKIH